MAPVYVTISLGFLMLRYAILPATATITKDLQNCIDTCYVASAIVQADLGILGLPENEGELIAKCAALKGTYDCFRECRVREDDLKKDKEESHYADVCEPILCITEATIPFVQKAKKAGLTADTPVEERRKFCPDMKVYAEGMQKCSEVEEDLKKKIKEAYTNFCEAAPPASDTDTGSEATTTKSSSISLKSAHIPVLVLVGLATGLVIGRK